MFKGKKLIAVIICVVVILAIAIPLGMKKFNGLNITKLNNQNQSQKNGDEDNIPKDNKDDNLSKDEGANVLDGNINNKNNENRENSGEKNSSNKIYDGKTYNVPNQELAILRIKKYSGIYIEDGSDKDVENVAAIQVKNTSNKAVEYAEIELKNGDKELNFVVSSLPPKSSAVVMERDKKSLDSSKVSYGDSKVAYVDKLEKDSAISYESVENNGIKLTNKSLKNIKTVRVFYKYKSEEGYYIGGITYTAKVENLEAKKSTTIYPAHYISDGAEVMMVKTYNE